jgi:hypothetical protein
VCGAWAGGVFRLELSKAQWQQRRHEVASQPAHKKQRAHAADAGKLVSAPQRKPRSHVCDLIAAGLVQPALECMFLTYQSQVRFRRVGTALRCKSRVAAR